MLEIDYRAMGKKVHLQRMRLQLTQEKLAEKVNISTSFLGHIERGTRVASIETLVSLCIALNVSPDYLLAESLSDSLIAQIPNQLPQHKKLVLKEIFQNLQETLENWNGPDEL